MYTSYIKFQYKLFQKNIYSSFVVPPKFCRSIVFNFSWGACKSQEKTMLMQNFEGTTNSIMVFLKKGPTSPEKNSNKLRKHITV